MLSHAKFQYKSPILKNQTHETKEGSLDDIIYISNLLSLSKQMPTTCLFSLFQYKNNRKMGWRFRGYYIVPRIFKVLFFRILPCLCEARIILLESLSQLALQVLMLSSTRLFEYTSMRSMLGGAFVCILLIGIKLFKVLIFDLGINIIWLLHFYFYKIELFRNFVYSNFLWVQK